MPKTIEQHAAEIRERYAYPGDDPAARLAHTNALFAEASASEWAVIATMGVYGDKVKTGLTWGDLLAIGAELERLRRDLAAQVEETQEIAAELAQERIEHQRTIDGSDRMAAEITDLREALNRIGDLEADRG